MGTTDHEHSSIPLEPFLGTTLTADLSSLGKGGCKKGSLDPTCLELFIYVVMYHMRVLICGFLNRGHNYSLSGVAAKPTLKPL